MNPQIRLNVMRLEDQLPTPLDLTKQISEALDLVKKKPSQRGRTSGTDSICSPCSEFGYESTCVPLSTSLPNGLAHQPVETLISATEDVPTDDGTIKLTKRNRTRGGKRERNGTGLQNVSSSHSHSRTSLPAVETLSSECSKSGQMECFSSEDSSTMEVTPSIPTTNGALLSQRVPENHKRKKERHLVELDFLQDSDSVESRHIASTSEAENADYFKPTQNGSGSSSSSSLSSSSQKMASTTKKNRSKQRTRCTGSKKATVSVAKRRKKKRSGSSSTLCAFPSHEPEIKLKYASCKEEKREGKGNTFAPYVRMEFSACTVVNFEEEGDFQVKKHRQPALSPGTVPTTSCLQLGRLGSEGRHQTGELCCLCGQVANATGLGDLHGPYHPCRPDMDFLINGHDDAGAKMKRSSDGDGERWVHEDCSIWSAGVFLVKGRLYGLDEAVRLAQEAVCSCCHRCGATLGCFFRGCPYKYHYPCALQAECVFNEENFTLRCPKHKNKSALGVSRLENR